VWVVIIGGIETGWSEDSVVDDVISVGRTLTDGDSPPVEEAVASMGCLLTCRLQPHPGSVQLQ